MLDEEALDRELGAWFARSGRVLEVREATTPWQVLVVEVMSQQTQIGRVGLHDNFFDLGGQSLHLVRGPGTD